MSEKTTTYRIGTLGEEPLLDMKAAHKCYSEFRKQFSGREPTQLRVSPGAFNHLRAMDERAVNEHVMTLRDKFMGCEIKVDYDMDDDTWQFCHETTSVEAV